MALISASPAAAQGTEPTCLYPGADAFSGSSLDLENRWTSTLRHDASLYTVADGKAKVQTGPFEIQEDENGNGAPNIFLQPAPEGTWEVTTKVKISQTHEGQQAGLLVSDPTGNDIVKLTYVKKQDGPTGNKWIEFLKIVDGQYDFSGTWHSPESPNYPDELMLRYRSDGDTLSGWYSVDNGQTWLSAGDSRDYEAIDDPQIGFYALRGAEADPAVTAEFDNFNLVPANDEFEGTAIDECRWTEIKNRNDAGMSVGGGELTLRTLEGELSGDQSGVQNLLLQKTNDSDWQATTKLTMTPTTAGQQAGLVIWGDNTDPAKANYVKLVFVRKNANATNNGWIEFLKTTDGATDFGTGDPYWNSGLGNYGPTVYLRLISADNQLSASWSADGETFTKVGVSHPLTGIQNPQVGLMALKGTDATKPEVDAKFDWFRIEPGETPLPPDPPECTTQAEPETGFAPIFDGTQESFDKWKHAGGGSFVLNDDGSMTSTNTAADPNLGLHWYEPTQYRNFSVRMQWKSAALTDNSGVFARFPNPGNDPNIAINQGHEIQINENPSGDPQKTGSIYNADRENYRNAKPLGEWNDYEITVVGQKYTVCLNGKVVNEYTSDKGRPLEGFIGVQNHDPTSKVSFRNIRVKELPDAPSVQNIFDTIGITQADTRANAQINGNPQKYSYVGEQLPPSRSLSIPPDDEDAVDNVPVRMPDTRGNVANLASFNGQEYFFTASQRKAYSKIHFFGTATDAGATPAGGEFTLTFADGSTEKINVLFRDWVDSSSTPDDHPALVADRVTTGGSTSGPFYIFHRPLAISEANRGKVLTSIKLPPNSGRAGAVRAYLMALTLEEADGTFESPILAGNADFPNDVFPPVSTATLDPAQPDGLDSWYKRHVAVTLASADEEGGSQLESIEYRIDGGAWLPYEGTPVLVDTDGNHAFQYRGLDRAGNLETAKKVDVKIDTAAPAVDVTLSPDLPAGTDWYDRAVRLELDPFDRNGSGVAKTEYSIDGGAWHAYSDPVTIETDGNHAVRYRAVDAAGNATGELTVPVRVDRTAPTTTPLLDGAAPVGTYGRPVQITFAAGDGNGAGVAVTRYRLDGGAWTDYASPITVSALGLHRIEFASIDAAGNPEAVRQIAFNRVEGPPTTGGQGGTPPAGGGDPAPKPEPWAALSAVRRSQSTIRAFRRGKLSVTISCQSVERGTLSLKVSKKVAKRLGLKSRTLAKAAVTCEGAQTTVTLKPSARVKRKLARKKRGSLEATLTVQLSGDSGKASDSALLTLRR